MLLLTGCFKAKVASQDNNKYKLRILKQQYALTYDINTKYQSYPLQFGEGKYIVALYKNIIDKKYALVSKLQLININNNYTLSSNQYVNYENIQILSDVVKNLFNQDKNITIKNIQQYILQNFTYDDAKIIEIKNLTINKLPNIKQCLQNQRGICQDLAALTVALFRANNIPSKLNIGYIQNKYHAWTEFYQNDEWIIFDPVAKIQNVSIDKKEYIPERWY